MKNLFLIIIITVFVSCTRNEKPDLNQFNWLLGKYQGGNDSIKMYEEWNSLSDSVMNGKGTVVFKTDTVFSEKIMLHVKGNSIYYQVTGAGNADVVDFKFIGTVKDTFMFENLEHDFPQKIKYIKTVNGIYAKVEGAMEGNYRKEEFNFNRLK